MTTILLVDEDPLHASVRKAILERKYADVRRVTDAAEALALVEQSKFAENLGLVVSGNQHSGIGLAGFISELHVRKPGLPILVIGERPSDQVDLSGYPVEFLKRPVTADDLLSAVAQMLKTWIPHQLKTA
jgi:DNA-binding NtrC family response regulator